MKYRLKYQNWYKALVHYPKRYRFYLTLLMLLALVSIWQVLLYRPFNRAIQFYRAKNKNFQSMTQELNNVQQQSVILSKNIQGLQRDIDGYQAQIQDVNEVMTSVIKEATQNNLILLTCVTEPCRDHAWYQLQSMRIEVQGTLGDLAQWFKKISDRSKLLSVSSVAAVQIDHVVVRCSATIQSIRIRTVA